MAKAKEIMKVGGNKQWWSEGVQFQCQGSGKCCTSHGEFGYVFFSPKDRKLAAQHLKIPEKQFRDQYCTKVEGAWALKEPENKSPDCIFLVNKRCSIYEARPTQCRTWPFWPDVMNAKAWTKAVVEFCPGVGKGELVSKETIDATLLEQSESEAQIMKES